MPANESKAAQALKPPTLAGLTEEMREFRSEIKNKVETLKIEFAKHYGATQKQIREGFAGNDERFDGIEERLDRGADLFGVIGERFDLMDKRFEDMDNRFDSLQRLLIGLLNVLRYKDVLSTEELAELVIPDDDD